MIFWATEGLSNTAIAERLQTSVAPASFWRRRVRERGLAGLYGEAPPGRPRRHDDDRIAAVINMALQVWPRRARQWTVRALADEARISKRTVQRCLARFDVQPQRSRSFKLFSDPFFVEKARDMVGLSLNPPDEVLALPVDEKSRIQALERSRPVLAQCKPRRRIGSSSPSRITSINASPRISRCT